jgi:hypothetical protein
LSEPVDTDCHEITIGRNYTAADGEKCKIAGLKKLSVINTQFTCYPNKPAKRFKYIVLNSASVRDYIVPFLKAHISRIKRIAHNSVPQIGLKFPAYSSGSDEEAVATYTARAAEKLRRQNSAASTLDVFLVYNGMEGKPYVYEPKHLYHHFLLLKPTADTSQLIKAALPLVETIFIKGAKYLKAGVVLGGLVPDDALQGNLFSAPIIHQNRALMQALDNINFSMRDDMVKFAATGLSRNWKMRQEMRSKRFTTRWDELYQIKCQ